MTETVCVSCGRVLAPTFIAGNWKCGACIEPPDDRKEPPMTHHLGRAGESQPPAYDPHGGPPPPRTTSRAPDVRTPSEAEVLAGQPLDPDVPDDVAPPSPETMEALYRAGSSEEDDRPTPQPASARSEPAESSPRVPSAPEPAAPRVGEVVPAGTLPPAPAALARRPQLADPVTVGDGLNDLRRFWKIGRWLAMTEGDMTPEGNARGAMRLFWAAEFDLPAAASRLIHVQKDGRVTLGAELLRALAEREGFRVLRVASTVTECTAVLIRADDGSEVGRSTYRVEQAERAGLMTRAAWRNHTEDMLWARASTRVLKDYAPRIALGIEDAEGYGGGQLTDADLEFRDYDPAPDPESDDDIPF